MRAEPDEARRAMGLRLCSLSVDLDEIHHYRRLHGRGPCRQHVAPVYGAGVERLAYLARELCVPVTWFAVGRDLSTDAARALARSLLLAGHAVENHSFSHGYDFGRLRERALRLEVVRAHEVIAAATGRAPVGFRAPGYARSAALLDLLAELGYRFDSSLLPSPPYYAAKAAVMARLTAAGRRSAAVLGDPRELFGRADPHPVRPPERPSAGPLWELPIQVLPGLRLPVIGTSLVLAGLPAARWLVRACARAPLINLELHGVDGLGPGDLCADLQGAQPDLAIPVERKLDVIRAVVGELGELGYRFVTLAHAVDLLAAARR